MKSRLFLRLAAASAALLVLLSLSSCEDEIPYDFFSTIHGAVYDAESGEPLHNASVTIMPTSRTLQTGSDGAFVFDELDPGQYTVSVQKEGYVPDRKSVTAISGETIRTDILLQKIQ